jgi:hypothetical protein
MAIYILSRNEPKDMYQLVAKGWDLQPHEEIFYGLDTALLQAGFFSFSPRRCEKRIYQFGNPHIGSSFQSFVEHEMETSRSE